MSKRSIVLACLGCLVAGYLAASVPGFTPINPFHPKPDRPILRLVQRLAKLGLWVAIFADPPPRPVEQQYAAAHHDGRAMICHAEGW